jgi:carbon-monoxide dehydrogenase large subunit
LRAGGRLSVDRSSSAGLAQNAHHSPHPNAELSRNSAKAGAAGAQRSDCRNLSGVGFLEAHRAYDPPSMTYSNATHLCEAVVDTRTGAIALGRYLVVEDCGTVLNPLIVNGQQHGAIAMGIGGVLLEEIVYDESGQNRSGSFADYLLPTALDIPPIEVISQHTPNRKTKTGSKGMAEGGVMGAIGAVMSAVNDALAPFDVHVDRQPLTPDYIRSLLRGKV